MKLLGKFFSAVIYLVYIAVFVLSLLVLGVSLVTTVVFRQYEENDLFDFVSDNVPLLILSMLAVFAVMLAVEAFVRFRQPGKKTILPTGNGGGEQNESGRARFPWVMLIVAGGVSLFLVLVIQGLPTADASDLDKVINQFIAGDYSALEPGGYLYLYPYQMPYVVLGELMAAVFGQSNYIAWQLLNVVAIECNLYFLYQIMWELFGDRGICRIMQVLACGAFCLFAFSTFIYNDLYSFAVQTAALYLEILYMKRGRLRYGIGAAFCIAAAYLLKVNSLIAMVAMIIMLIVHAVRKAEGKKLAAAAGLSALMIALCLGSSAAIDFCTVRRTGIESMPEGVPNITFVAMSLQTAEGKCGWYNGFTKGTYTSTGYDAEATTEASIAAIEESLAEFDNSGRYFVNFFYQKFISQWGDPTCVSMREMENTSRHTGELSTLADSLIFGTGSQILQWVMNVFHSMIYLGMVIYTGTIILRRRRPSTEEAFLVVFIFGGMLFHELWEASGRYTMRYYLTMLPLAAWGWSRLTEAVLRKISGCNALSGK